MGEGGPQLCEVRGPGMKGGGAGEPITESCFE